MAVISYDLLCDFTQESLQIEGIYRPPTKDELQALLMFLSYPTITLRDVLVLQRVYAPNQPLRTTETMNVRVGNHIAPKGGEQIRDTLQDLVQNINLNTLTPYKAHGQFLVLHPFMDGNGRTSRALWAWHMFKDGQDPFSLNFLHRWYYQSLAALTE